MYTLAHVCKNIYRAAARLLASALAAGMILVASSVPAHGQTNGQTLDRKPAVFLDCGWCYESFIRQEMTEVDYVRDRENADVHALITSEQAGGGGRRYTFDLIGLGPFAGQDFSATYTSAAVDTEEVRRTGLVRSLRLALVPYLMQSAVGPRLALSVEDGDGEQAVAEDPWNGWTFEIYGDGSADMEASQYSLDARYGIFVDRVTEEWKIRLRPYFNYNFDKFEREDETITSESRRDGFDSFVIRSVSEHWSVGLFGDVYRSTFSNIDLRFRGAPAVEYSFFPYQEANRRQLTVAYRAGMSDVQYVDTTIFDQKRELLPQHAVVAEYELTQTWGSVDVGAEGLQYLHDRSKYRFEVDVGVSVRLTRGLALRVGGDVQLIHDQLNLPKGDASLEEVLLRRRQLQTSYELRVSAGFEYRFGSIYDNVVNTRF